MIAAPAEPRVLPPALAYAALAAACALAAVGVLVLDRPPAPGALAASALALDALLLGLLALVEGRSRAGAREPGALRASLLAVASVGLAPVGWFFGPNAGFEAAIALAILLTGVLSREGRGAPVSWLVYALLAGGQAVVLSLVVAGWLPDESLTRVIIPGHPMWHHVAAHAAAQGVFLAAFLAGRDLRARYAAVARERERAIHDASLRAVLLEEARAEYRSALELGRRAAASAGIVTPSRPPPRSDLAAPPSRPASTPPPAAGDDRRSRPGDRSPWLDAYRRKMRGQSAAVIGLCVAGTVILGVIARNRGPMWVAMACMGVIAVAAAAQRALAHARHDETGYWPWVVIGALSAGPAYAFGLHSAFSCVIVAVLFVGGSFRARVGRAEAGSRVPVLVAVTLAHGVTFALIASGVIGDDGNVPVLGPSGTSFEPVAQHVLLQALYVAAFAGGWALDARHDALAREAELAAASAARATAMLARAGEDLDRALAAAGGGIFAGERVGRFAIERLLASGGMGDVYESRDEATGARVAVKLLRRDRAGDPLALELFAKEARALARVRSAHVASILEAGVGHESLPYIAMELIEGRTLAAILRERTRLPEHEVRAMIADVARGLRDIHDAGIVHRDVKPQNVMLTTSDGAPRWKIVDFGVAQLHDVVGGASGGTAAYTAPEQALGERVDPRADLYSLSLVAYRALTGRPAFVGAEPEAIALEARTQGPPDPRGYLELRRDLELALRIGLAPVAKDRFATARELAGAFEAAFDGRLDERHRKRGAELLARAPWSRPGTRAIDEDR